jgi:hypothetical protein
MIKNLFIIVALMITLVANSQARLGKSHKKSLMNLEEIVWIYPLLV